jgi:hypothetical protein
MKFARYVLSKIGELTTQKRHEISGLEKIGRSFFVLVAIFMPLSSQALDLYHGKEFAQYVDAERNQTAIFFREACSYDRNSPPSPNSDRQIHWALMEFRSSGVKTSNACWTEYQDPSSGQPVVKMCRLVQDPMYSTWQLLTSSDACIQASPSRVFSDSTDPEHALDASTLVEEKATNEKKNSDKNQLAIADSEFVEIGKVWEAHKALLIQNHPRENQPWGAAKSPDGVYALLYYHECTVGTDHSDWRWYSAVLIGQKGVAAQACWSKPPHSAMPTETIVTCALASNKRHTDPLENCRSIPFLKVETGGSLKQLIAVTR